jgi:adenosylcobinamide kinase/adenosylcobinamide-phosphate guanylyltransferase
MALTLLLGGARSGKSALAVAIAQRQTQPVTFLATGEPRDAEMAERIARHRAERPSTWRTIAEPTELARAIGEAPPGECLIVDCLSLWVANAGDRPIARAAEEAAALAAGRAGPTIAVTNEVGMGIVPISALGRRYRDVLGRVNAIWAAAADRVLLVVAGRVLELGAWDGDLGG